VRIGDLAEREGVSAPTATRIVAALEQQGVVRREPDVADRRSWRVSLTATGRDRLVHVRRVRTARLAQRLAALDPTALDRLIEALPVLEALAGEE
jgi:DNA-binding MarR family transcriptional regulator